MTPRQVDSKLTPMVLASLRGRMLVYATQNGGKRWRSTWSHSASPEGDIPADNIDVVTNGRSFRQMLPEVVLQAQGFRFRVNEFERSERSAREQERFGYFIELEVIDNGEVYRKTLGDSYAQDWYVATDTLERGTQK